MTTKSLPTSMQAIIVNGTTAALKSSWPLPALRDDYILVEVHSIALNPTDWKHVAYELAGPDSMLGCDYAGTVVEVGSKVTKLFSPGDRICGCAHGANFDQPSDGVFAQYAVVKGDVQMKIAHSLTFEQAATLPLGIVTVGQGLYQKSLKLDLPNPGGPKKDEWVLIYGGSSATGSLGVQFTKLSGYKVISTASRKFRAFVEALGADKVFDYNEANCGQEINKFTNDGLRLCWDTISVQSSVEICSQALSSSCFDDQKCELGILQLGVKPPREDLDVTRMLMYTVFGETFHHRGGVEYPASSEDFIFGGRFVERAEQLLVEGLLKPHPQKLGERGLEGALQGLQDLKDGKVSSHKPVYRVADTPTGSDLQVKL